MKLYCFTALEKNEKSAILWKNLDGILRVDYWVYYVLKLAALGHEDDTAIV